MSHDPVTYECPCSWEGTAMEMDYALIEREGCADMSSNYVCPDCGRFPLKPTLGSLSDVHEIRHQATEDNTIERWQS